MADSAGSSDSDGSSASSTSQQRARVPAADSPSSSRSSSGSDEATVAGSAETPRQDTAIPNASQPKPTELPPEIKIGMPVEVLVAPKGQGVVRFAGTTQFSTGVWIGVELPGPEGRNDGSVQGVRYFTCLPNCGIFVRRKSLKLLPEAVHKTPQQALEKPEAISDTGRQRQPPSPVSAGSGRGRGGAVGRGRGGAVSQPEELIYIVASAGIDTIGLGFASIPPSPLLVKNVISGTWAATAGFRAGDEIAALNGKRSNDMSLEEFKQAVLERPLRFSVRRRASLSAEQILGRTRMGSPGSPSQGSSPRRPLARFGRADDETRSPSSSASSPASSPSSRGRLQPPSPEAVKTVNAAVKEADVRHRSASPRGLGQRARGQGVSSAWGAGGGAGTELQVVLLSAHGLPESTSKGSRAIPDTYCTCEISGKAHSRVRTEVARETLNPSWNLHAGIPGYSFGDSLEFAVWDAGQAKWDGPLGKAELAGFEFHSSGFVGDLPLLNRRIPGTKATLKVQVLTATTAIARAVKERFPGKSKFKSAAAAAAVPHKKNVAATTEKSDAAERARSVREAVHWGESLRQAPAASDQTAARRVEQAKRAADASASKGDAGSEEALSVTIVECKGLQLRAPDSETLLNPFCICKILGKPRLEFRTHVLPNTLNPKWNHSGSLQPYSTGDSVCFTVCDRDPGDGDDLLGESILASSDFYPKGLDGEVVLLNSPQGSRPALTVKIEVKRKSSEAPEGELIARPSSPRFRTGNHGDHGGVAAQQAALAAFRQLLLKRGGNYGRAWRYFLDLGGKGRLTMPELTQRCRELGYHGNMRALWQALDCNSRGMVALADIDGLTADALFHFRAELLARVPAAAQLAAKKDTRISEPFYADEEVDEILDGLLQCLDCDSTGRLTRYEFCSVAKALKLALPAKVPQIFEMLCRSTPAAAASDRPAAVITRSELLWLWNFGRELGEVACLGPNAGAPEEETDVLGGGRLRRVWLEEGGAPPIFARLRSDATRREEDRRRREAPAAPEAPPSNVNEGIFDFLYEDAQRREAARQVAEEEHFASLSSSASRAPNPEALERLAQPRTSYQVEEPVGATASGGKPRPVNAQRLQELYEEGKTKVSKREQERLDTESKEVDVARKAQQELSVQRRTWQKQFGVRDDNFKRIKSVTVDKWKHIVGRALNVEKKQGEPDLREWGSNDIRALLQDLAPEPQRHLSGKAVPGVAWAKGFQGGPAGPASGHDGSAGLMDALVTTGPKRTGARSQSREDPPALSSRSPSPGDHSSPQGSRSTSANPGDVQRQRTPSPSGERHMPASWDRCAASYLPYHPKAYEPASTYVRSLDPVPSPPRRRRSVSEKRSSARAKAAVDAKLDRNATRPPSPSPYPRSRQKARQRS